MEERDYYDEVRSILEDWAEEGTPISKIESDLEDIVDGLKEEFENA